MGTDLYGVVFDMTKMCGGVQSSAGKRNSLDRDSAYGAGGKSFPALRRQGQFDGKCRAFVNLALHIDLTAVPFDDPIGNGKTQSCAFIAFGGEEGIKYPLQVFFDDPGPGIGYLQTDVLLVFRICFDGDASAKVHGFAGVEQHVDKNLFNLVLISRDKRQIRLIVPDDVDIVKA